MDNVFGAGEQITQTEVKQTSKGSEEKKQKIKEMVAIYEQTVATDPTFVQKLHSLSNDIVVTHTLGYGTSGNIIVDKKATQAKIESGMAEKDARTLVPTSQIVGYEVKNVGPQAIKYKTEEWKKDPADPTKFVGEVVEKTFAPGETINLTRKFMTMLCAQPAISFTLQNGKIVSSTKKAKDLDEELASYYFSFNKGENDDVKIEVNDDEVKLRIDVDNKVKPEYELTFGYLNNPKAKKDKATGSTKAKTSAQDIAANYVQKMLEKQGL